MQSAPVLLGYELRLIMSTLLSASHPSNFFFKKSGALIPVIPVESLFKNTPCQLTSVQSPPWNGEALTHISVFSVKYGQYLHLGEILSLIIWLRGFSLWKWIQNCQVSSLGKLSCTAQQLSWDCLRCWVICFPEAGMFSGSNSSEMDLKAQLSFSFFSVSPQQCLLIYLKPKSVVFSNWLVIIKSLGIPPDFYNWWAEELKILYSLKWHYLFFKENKQDFLIKETAICTGRYWICRYYDQKINSIQARLYIL